VTMVGPNGFQCTDEIFRSEPCYFTAECAAPKVCGSNQLCLGRCGDPAEGEECAVDQRGCSAQYPVRRCSSVEIALSATQPYTLFLGSGFSATAPDDIVYSSQRRSFMVSLPGTREIAEGFVGQNGVVGVRHIR
jgi:hypothetical protein